MPEQDLVGTMAVAHGGISVLRNLLKSEAFAFFHDGRVSPCGSNALVPLSIVSRSSCDSRASFRRKVTISDYHDYRCYTGKTMIAKDRNGTKPKERRVRICGVTARGLEGVL